MCMPPLTEMFAPVMYLLDVPWDDDGLDLFERLVAAAPGDHSAYLDAGDAVLASISPEVFLRIEGDRCETRPIKGTRRRGATPAEDAALEAELRASVKDPSKARLVSAAVRAALGAAFGDKDRAENVMIVDLLRNDLVPTSVRGSVRVTALCEVERTTSVLHLVSSVVATVRPDVRHPDVLVSCFPGGSITGEHGVGVDKACSMPLLFGEHDLGARAPFPR